MANEIKKFSNAVTNNTISLLNESRELKANTRKIEYQEKVQKARYLIDYYIITFITRNYEARKKNKETKI